MTASELTIGETFKKNGILLKVAEVENYKSEKSGLPYVSVKCYSNGSTKIDSFFDFKPNTKVK